jgi:hypothetical protein
MILWFLAFVIEATAAATISVQIVMGLQLRIFFFQN